MCNLFSRIVFCDECGMGFKRIHGYNGNYCPTHREAAQERENAAEWAKDHIGDILGIYRKMMKVNEGFSEFYESHPESHTVDHFSVEWIPKGIAHLKDGSSVEMGDDVISNLKPSPPWR